MARRATQGNEVKLDNQGTWAPLVSLVLRAPPAYLVNRGSGGLLVPQD